MRKLFVLFLSGIMIDMVSAQTELKPVVEEKKEEAKSRLNLTPEQQEKMKAIRKEKHSAMKKRHEENQEFKKNLDKKTKTEVDAVLSPAQKAELEKMKQERKNNRGGEGRERGKGHRKGKGHHRGHGDDAVDSAAVAR